MQRHMFFLRRTRPLELTAGRMRALRLSLNTPVVATQELPVGPARAAIAIHAEPRGGLGITVGVRSLAGGSVVLYGFEGAVTAGVVNEVMDAALSFAEGMGFLFDDELVGNDPASQEKALVRWREALGSGEGTFPDAGLEAEPEPVLELFDLEGGDLTDPPVPAPLPPTPQEPLRLAASPLASPEAAERAPDEPAFEPAVELPATLPLTKFRLRADRTPEPKELDESPAPKAPAKRPLGRLRLERRRSNKLVQDARRSWLLRLLTSF
jgi:hypothetical protein